jgi:hypothetical protein
MTVLLQLSDDATQGEPRNNSQMIYVGILRMRLDTLEP